MLNLLRFVLIVVTGLVVFGWSLVAGQTPKPPATSFGSFAYEPPRIQPVFGTPKLAAEGLATSTGVRRPRFAVRDGHISQRWLDRDSSATVDPEPDFTIIARPVAAAELRIFDGKTAASHVVALTPSATVNLRLLSQRIASHNLSARAIEDQLRGRQHWDLLDLESIASQLEDVMQARDLWLMYYSVVDSRKRRALGPIASLAKSIDLLRQRLFETQVAVDVDHARISGFSKEETRRRLSVLDRKTTDWSELAEE